jgi:plastocyanin
MKKIYLTLLAIVAFAGINAQNSYTVSIVGNAYTPTLTTVNVGDVVTIQATGNHPLVQVDQPTWSANGATPMTGGWGTKTTNHTFTVTSAGNIYFVCQFHVSMGMKGMITAVSVNGLSDNSLNVSGINVFPNPVSEKLNVSLTSKENMNASFKLFSILGQEVATLSASQAIKAGENEIVFVIPASVATGNYFLQINSGTLTTSKKVVIVK